MSRRVYISCDFNERELLEVKALCDFLSVSKCVLEFAPSPGWSFYRVLEEAIERSDAFVAVVGVGRKCSTWLAYELDYAHTLNRFRLSARRPRLFALRVKGYSMPPCAEHISVEWLDESNHELLLVDLPKRVP